MILFAKLDLKVSVLAARECDLYGLGCFPQQKTIRKGGIKTMARQQKEPEHMQETTVVTSPVIKNFIQRTGAPFSIDGDGDVTVYTRPAQDTKELHDAGVVKKTREMQ